MGSTQGVKVSSSPNPKKASRTSDVLPEASERAMRSCSGSSPAAAMSEAEPARSPASVIDSTLAGDEGGSCMATDFVIGG